MSALLPPCRQPDDLRFCGGGVIKLPDSLSEREVELQRIRPAHQHDILRGNARRGEHVHCNQLFRRIDARGGMHWQVKRQQEVLHSIPRVSIFWKPSAPSSVPQGNGTQAQNRSGCNRLRVKGNYVAGGVRA